jgi:hypothetical protein
MRLFTSVISFLFISISSTAQSRWQLGLFAGASQYQGDLQSGIFQGRFAHPVVGLTGSYELAPRLALRAGLTFSAIEASDKFNRNELLRPRNFSFHSKISELCLVATYNIFNLTDTRWSPYIFGGVAVFHFNPYTYDSSGQKWYLQPLGTEGQGLAAYPDRKPYATTQFAIPFGGGVTYALTERWQLGLELGLRKTFTDYLDDVSSTYAGRDELLAGRGPKAVELAFRQPEVDPAASYPQKGAMRGKENRKDLYYFIVLHLQMRFGGGSGRNGCPKLPE